MAGRDVMRPRNTWIGRVGRCVGTRAHRSVDRKQIEVPIDDFPTSRFSSLLYIYTPC